MPRIIPVYILKEMLVPFLLGLAILTVTMLVGNVFRLTDLLLGGKIGSGYILLFLISIIPTSLIYTIPASFLVGLLISWTRLSSDCEIIAMKACGISMFDLIRPVIFLAVITYLLTLMVTLYLSPWGNLNIKRIIFEIAKNSATLGLEEKTFSDDFKGVIVYVDDIPEDGGELRGIFISEKTEEGEIKIITAEKGMIAARAEELAMRLYLKNGAIHRKKKNEDIYHLIKFDGYAFSLAAGKKIDAGSKYDRELYPGELLQKIKEKKERKLSFTRNLMDFHRRFSLPMAVFVFALIGIPLGMQKVRAAGATGFGIAIVVLIAYYILSKSLEALGDNNYIHPVIAAWGTNAILGSLGLYIFWRTAKEKPLIAVSAIEDMLQGILKKILRHK